MKSALAQNNILRGGINKLTSVKTSYSAVLNQNGQQRQSNVSKNGAIPKENTPQKTAIKPKLPVKKPNLPQNESSNKLTQPLENSDKNDAYIEDAFIIPRRKRKTNTIKGTNEGSSEIKGVKRYAHFHVFGIHTDISTEQLTETLKKKSLSNLKCEKVTSKRPEEYSSFKISVIYEEQEIIKNPI
ncbi:hypothetical protein HHI36_008467 [Cryptolaemus montrouzieri]|uniref:Uncharacterized protein n=1 Tax=Cryptolaemus montrouzieri TaxID=559131 RepID=A0ABD2MT50_9CUCU